MNIEQLFGWDCLSHASLNPRARVSVTGPFSAPALLVTAVTLPFRCLLSALNTFNSCILDSAVIMVQLSPWLPCAGGEPVLIGSNLMTLSHHRVKLQKMRSSYEDAMKGNHHHPWLPRVHVGGHQGRGSPGALASHSGHLINDNGDSSICFSTNSSCFLLLHLLYELTSCALSFPRLASRMAQSTLYLLHVCVESFLCGKSKYHLKYIAVETGQYLTASPTTAGSWEEGQPPSPPLSPFPFKPRGKRQILFLSHCIIQRKLQPIH